MKKSNIQSKERKDVIFTFLVEDGVSTGFETELTGDQIEQIETLIENIFDENDMQLQLRR